MYDLKTVQAAQKLVLHDSLHTYKVKNSRSNIAGQVMETPTKKGAIALFCSKDSMQKAMVLWSPLLKHWMPSLIE
ncbi:hypothetical protein QTN53_12270 [Levilactobacillus brevis]|uniref:hypothetical protein n=1 Tax=Levilactobacillus brevis TaxID=1580 RepID=UPI0025A56D3D|nr:hypothetical protein [Levilactobacillus brevis]MDM5047578.1 hypothetical protein [Levilactobacillus brevis]